jgi:hypothetical protein
VLILDCLFDDVRPDELRGAHKFLRNKSNGYIARFFKYAVDGATLAVALPRSCVVALILTTWKITDQQGKQILAIPIAVRKELSLEIAIREIPPRRSTSTSATTSLFASAPPLPRSCPCQRKTRIRSVG